MRFLSILARELKNTQKVYLYNIRDHWYAYEQSAFFVSTMPHNNVRLERVVNKTYQIMIDRAEVDLDILETCSVLLCSDTEIVIDKPSAN